MRKTTVECLKHYLSQLPTGKGGVKAQKTLKSFTGVSSNAIRHWSLGERSPQGLVLVKVRYFLETQGYRVAELEDLPKPVRDLGKLIAYGFLDWGEVAGMIGIVDKWDLFKLFKGTRSLSEQRMEIVEKICDRNRDKLDRLSKADSTQIVPAAAPTIATSVVANEIEEVLCLLRNLDGVIFLLKPRLVHMLSDGFTPEQRQAFREKAGRELVFDLANRFYKVNKMLNALCSEKARELTESKNQNQNQNQGD